MTLELTDLVEGLAAEAGDVIPKQTPNGTVYVRSGRTFAAVDHAAIELRLMPDIAEAAMRTPSAGPSARGEEWISFAPPEWDEHATDRLDAWFRVAWRLAEPGR